MKKTKAAIKWTITVLADAQPELYGETVAAIEEATTALQGVGTVTRTGPTIVRVEV